MQELYILKHEAEPSVSSIQIDKCERIIYFTMNKRDFKNKKQKNKRQTEREREREKNNKEKNNNQTWKKEEREVDRKKMCLVTLNMHIASTQI